jgi:hypothetical protein
MTLCGEWVPFEGESNQDDIEAGIMANFYVFTECAENHKNAVKEYNIIKGNE